jgi:hypothetical protein
VGRVAQHRSKTLRRTKLRIQFDIDDRIIGDLETTMRKVGVSTKRELCNLAISLLEWAANERTKGRIIASVDPETERYQQVILPALENLWKISREMKTKENAPAQAAMGAASADEIRSEQKKAQAAGV